MDKIDQRLAQRMCKNCDFSKRSEGQTEGYYCQRYPQKMFVTYPGGEGGSQFEQHFPWMAPDAWCGEFQPRSILPVAGETATCPHGILKGFPCTPCDIEAANANSSTDETRAPTEAEREQIIANTISEPIPPQDDGLVERLKAPPTLHNDAPEGYFLISRETIADMLSARTEAAACITALKAQVAEVTRERAEAREKFVMHTSEVEAWLGAFGGALNCPDIDTTVAAYCKMLFDAATATVVRAEKAEAELTDERTAREKAELGLQAANASIAESAELARSAHAELTAARSTIAAQAAEIEAIREALRQFGVHYSSCPSNHVIPMLKWDACDCGLNAALTEGEEKNG